jgi:hypothetical protein
MLNIYDKGKEMERPKLSRVEITQRQRKRAKILKAHAESAGFEPVQIWLRKEVKASLDHVVDMHSQFDLNDLIDAVLTYALRDELSVDVSLPVNEIDPCHPLFRLSAYITTRKGKRLGWRAFNDAKLKAEVEIMERQGTASDRVRQLLQMIEAAKQPQDGSND